MTFDTRVVIHRQTDRTATERKGEKREKTKAGRQKLDNARKIGKCSTNRARARERERERKGGRGGDARNKRRGGRRLERERARRAIRTYREARRGKRYLYTPPPYLHTPLTPSSAPHLTPHLTHTSTPYLLHASRFMRRGGLTTGTEVNGGLTKGTGELTSWCFHSTPAPASGGFHSTPAPVFGVLEDKAA
jgi:hypothetical protein